MMRTLFLTSATAFWLIMTSLLVQKNFFQTTAIHENYEVLPLGLDIREEYNAVLLGDERIGFNFTTLEANQDSKDTSYAYELRYQTFLTFRFLGHAREMLTQGSARLDHGLTLLSFDLRIASGKDWTKIKGKAVKDHWDIIIESNEGEPTRKTLPYKGPVYFSEALRFLWTPENLLIGKKGTIQTLNPLALDFQTIYFEVTAKTKVDYEGKSVEAYEIQMHSGDLITRTWVGLDGIVLKEEGLTGIIQIKEEGWQIFDAMRKKKGSLPDLPNLFSVPSDKILEDPASLGRLKIKITTPSEERVMDIPKQSLAGLDHIALPVTLDTPEIAKSMQPSTWIESENPEMVAQSKKIVGGKVSALEASLAILKWVHENVSPVPSMGIPKATQVLVSKKGDCNEYTVLFTALARAAGIPTRMIAGLVYQDGRFFYHAWPEIYLGRWIGVDPTFGQAPVDVTHIPLVEGGIEEQVALASQLGRIKIQVLEAK